MVPVLKRFFATGVVFLAMMPTLMLFQNCESPSSPKVSADSDGDGKLDSLDCAPSEAGKWQLVSVLLDADSDGVGSGTILQVCASATLPPNYIKAESQVLDCDDNNSNVSIPIEYFVDSDGDNYGSTNGEEICSEFPSSGYARDNSDPDDSDSDRVPSDSDGDSVANENDCAPNDSTKFKVWTIKATDVDGDGFKFNLPQDKEMCFGSTLPSGFYVLRTSSSEDCDDSNDEITRLTFFPDWDRDGVGNLDVPFSSCTRPATEPGGYVWVDNGLDCNDWDANIGDFAQQLSTRIRYTRSYVSPARTCSEFAVTQIQSCSNGIRTWSGPDTSSNQSCEVVQNFTSEVTTMHRTFYVYGYPSPRGPYDKVTYSCRHPYNTLDLYKNGVLVSTNAVNPNVKISCVAAYDIGPIISIPGDYYGHHKVTIGKTDCHVVCRYAD